MAGPGATILLPIQLGESGVAVVRAEIGKMADSVKGDDFPIAGRPFGTLVGPEYPEQMDDYAEQGLPGMIGWPPKDAVGFFAYSNDMQDHHILGKLCLHVARKYGGVIDFGGSLIAGKSVNEPWDKLEPAFKKLVEGLPGSIHTVQYTSISGKSRVYHVGDADFLAAWMASPNFRMVK